MDQTERHGIEQRIQRVIGLVDQGDLDAAETQVRDIENRVELTQKASLETEFAALLSGIGEMYHVTTVQ